MTRSPRITPKAVEARRHQEIDEILAKGGYTQEQVANYLTRRLGTLFKNYDISRFASGKVRVTADVMDALRELAAAPVDEPSAVINLGETAEVVPLFGYANAAGAILRINDDQRVGVVPIHPAQRGSRQAYAFICFGDSVSPRLNHGEVGYAIRNKPPMKGGLCVIRMNTGEALVKFYEGQDERTLFASQLQPKEKSKLSYSLQEVVGLDAVVGSSFG